MRIKHPMNILRPFKTVRISSINTSLGGTCTIKVSITAIDESRDYEVEGTAEADSLDKAENLAMLKALIRLNELTLDGNMLLQISCSDLFDNELEIDTVDKLKKFVEYCMPGVEQRITENGIAITVEEAGAIELFMLQQQYQQELDKEKSCEKKQS